MGLLSKAAEGTSKDDAILSSDEQSRGGLLKLISQKHRQKNEENIVPIREEKKKSVISSSIEKTDLENLFESYSKFGVFKGLIFEAIKQSAGEFKGRLSNMVSGFGTAHDLAMGRVLVIFGSDQDGELIGKHLARTIPGNNVFGFQANTPREAFSLIKPFL
ncbi:MAG: hypothetical protein FWG07_09690 [Treponema sp.]|nr:hypothetical protein [Treponema sp.]